VRAQQQGTPPPAPPPSPVIARIGGRPITQQQFDEIAQPYFARLEAQLKDAFTEDLRKIAKHNVLDELFRRELLSIEAERQKIPVTEVETDKILRQDPFFQTNGKFDEQKFIAYKTNPGSNYLTVLPKVREIAATAKLDRMLRARFTPSPATVRAEFAKRNDQVQFKFLSLAERDMSLDPETTEEEQKAYYAAHPDQFEKKPQVALRYFRLPLPPPTDTLRATQEATALVEAQSLADSLRAGAPFDTLAARHGGVVETGLFEAQAAFIPGLGRIPELTAVLARADSDTTLRVVGPAKTNEAVIVGVISDRQPRRIPPFNEIVADVKRRADQEKRRTTQEADRLAYYEAHKDQFHTTRLTLTRVSLPYAAARASEPSAKAVEKWYAANARTLIASADSGAQTPALTDSLRTVIRTRLTSDARRAAAYHALAELAADWSHGKDPRSRAQKIGALVDTPTFTKGSPSDSLFPLSFVDSLVSEPHLMRTGVVHGPRSFEKAVAVWRVETVDTAYVQSYEQVKARIEPEVLAEKNKKDEAEALTYFEAHKTNYKTKPKFVIDYISVKIPPPDSVTVPEADIRKYYDTHLAAYKQEEQVHARHILISVDPSQGPAADARAKARADSLLGALRNGADFADLARRFSQDPGSGRAGGELGSFPRGRMVKEFENAAFALEPGQISQVVKTQFGYHIIKVEEHQKAGTRPYADVRNDIRFQLAQSRGDSTAKKTAETIRKAIARGADAAAQAAPYGGVVTSQPFALSDPVQGLGVVQELDKDLDKLQHGRWATRVYKEGVSYVLVRLKDRVPVQQAAFDEVKQQVLAEVQDAKKKDLLEKKVAAIRVALRSGASLDSVAAPYGGLKDSGLLNHSNTFIPYLGNEPRLVEKAFTMKKGAVSDTVRTAQGVAWIRVEQKTTNKAANWARDREAITQEILSKKYDEWLQAKKKTVKIEVLRADLRETPPPPKPVVTVVPSRKGG
jgi:parvulin-like peptidyl-prolyl isomerase